MYFYTDKKIIPADNDVLLCGGYSGHANFGDILQLRSTLAFYNQNDYSPIIIIRLDSIYDTFFIQKLYDWFEIKGVIFYSEVLYDTSALPLVSPEDFSCRTLHLYGGGMINTMWADLILNLCASLITTFGVSRYILSGQQIDAYGAQKLQEHFQKFPPALVYARDYDSLEQLQKHGMQAFYGFDDAYEALEELSHKFVRVQDAQELYLHLNLSPYVADDLVAFVRTYGDVLLTLKAYYPHAKVTLLLSYLDSRILSIVDTLGAIGSLDYKFDFDEVRVLNLANMALSQGDDRFLFAYNAIMVTTSYHTAMLGQMLGLKVHFFANNKYYKQKKKALELKTNTIYETLEQHLYRDSLHEQRTEARKLYYDKLRALFKVPVLTSSKRYKSVEVSHAKGIFLHKPIQTNLSENSYVQKKISQKIFGIGWAKTGTTTLGKVLQILGYKHKTQDFALVEELMQGRFEAIKRVVHEHDSFEDWPWLLMYKQLDVLFPNAKFILTIRDEQSWLKSYRNMLSKEPPSTQRTNEMRSFLYGLAFPDVSDEALLARYRAHNQEVLNYFSHRSEQLLVVDWTKEEAWERICTFLNKEVPKQPIPHENKGKYK